MFPVNRTARHAATITSRVTSQTRSLFGFSLFGSAVKKATEISNKQPVPTPTTQNTIPSTSTPPPLPSQTSDETHVKAKASAVAARDAEVMQKLLDMDGGNAGFEFQDGKPAGGQGRETKRNMFRVM